MQKAQDLTQGKIGKTLLIFSMPIIAGMLLQTAFSIVDAFFVGMLGPLELAAVSIAFPIIFIFIAISSGLEIGTNALVSQAVGKNDLKKAGNFSVHAIILAGVLAAIVTVASFAFAGPAFRLMTNDETVISLAFQYSTPLFACAIFAFIWAVSDALLRAEGDSKTPMKNLVFAIALNCIFDPLLIFGIGPFPMLGLFGAAITDVFGNIIAAALNFRHIFSGKAKVKLPLKGFKPNLGKMKELLSVGFPATVSTSISAIGFLLMTAVVGAFGSLAIAAYGIGMRINSISVLPSVGMESAVASFAGQNYGAKNFGRAKKVGVYGAKISLALAGAIAVILMLFPAQLTGIFTTDPEVIRMGAMYLSIVPLAYLLFGLYFPMQGAFQGVGKTWIVLATNIAYWAIALGLSFLLSAQMGIIGIWIALVSAATIEAVATILIFNSGAWLKQKKAKK